MTLLNDLLNTATSVRDQLYELSQNGDYSPIEREGFSRLRMFYHQQLERFFLAPCCGDSSDKYALPQNVAIAALAQGNNCQPGNQQSQQAYYNAVYDSSDRLRDVTATISKPFKVAPG